MSSSTPGVTAVAHGPTMWLNTLLELAQRRAQIFQMSRQITNEGQASADEEACTKDKQLCVKQTEELAEENVDAELEEERLGPDGESITKAIAGIAELYSRAWNLGMANNILNRLPQEMCDMIYSELIHPRDLDLEYDAKNYEMYDEEESIAYRHSTSAYRKKGKFGKLGSHVYPLLTVEDYPHWFHQTYMGSVFVTGLSGTFHSTRNFHLLHPADLCSFLSKDRLGTTCIPSQHIKQLEIHVALGSFNTDTGKSKDWSNWRFETPLKRHYLSAVKGLDVLRNIPCRRGAKITLRLRCRANDERPKFAEVLYRFVYAMKARGWVVEVQVIGDNEMTRGEQDPLDFDYSRDKTIWEEAERSASNSK